VTGHVARHVDPAANVALARLVRLVFLGQLQADRDFSIVSIIPSLKTHMLLVSRQTAAACRSDDLGPLPVVTHKIDDVLVVEHELASETGPQLTPLHLEVTPHWKTRKVPWIPSWSKGDSRLFGLQGSGQMESSVRREWRGSPACALILLRICI
jgi:hypothetical protein